MSILTFPSLLSSQKGVEDLIVGAYLYEKPSNPAVYGAVYVLFLTSGSILRNFVRITLDEGGLAWPLQDGDKLGSSVEIIHVRTHTLFLPLFFSRSISRFSWLRTFCRHSDSRFWTRIFGPQNTGH
jgi:hypothetical protein